MAEFTPSKKTAQDFNDGVEYVDGIGDIEGDAVHAESINNVIEGLLYTQGIAVNQPDVSEADQVGTVSASIVIAADGTARLKLSNLKGKQGVGISTIVEDGTDANGGNKYKLTLDDGRAFDFVAPKGAKGDTGNGISSTVISYATSASGATPPTSGWQATIPTVSKGSYLWTRTVSIYTDETPSTSYTLAYQGKDGDGAVTSVNGQTGAVTITPEGIGAIPRDGSAQLQNIELYYSTPYIDFHWDNTTSDYNVRIINSANGVLELICGQLICQSVSNLISFGNEFNFFMDSQERIWFGYRGGKITESYCFGDGSGTGALAFVKTGGLIVNPIGNSFNEGLRINGGVNWSTISLGAEPDTLSGSDSNKGFIIARPKNYSRVVITGHTNMENTARRFEVSRDGVIFSQGNQVTSDERDKTDIESIDSVKALEFISQIDPITYVNNYRADYVNIKKKTIRKEVAQTEKRDADGNLIYQEPIYEDVEITDYEDENTALYSQYGMAEYDRVAHERGDKKGERRRVGVKAQQVYDILKDVYGTDNYAQIIDVDQYDLRKAGNIPPVENKLTVDYTRLVPFLIAAIQEQQKQINELRNTLNYYE